MSLRAESLLRPTSSYTFNESTVVNRPVVASLPDTAGPVFAFATSTPSIVVFQPTYPAVLAHREINTKNLHVKELVSLANNLVAVISSTTNDAAAERWMVHTVDMTVPVDGVGIAQLLDSASLTTRFLQSTTAASSEAKKNPAPEDPYHATAARDQVFLSSLRSKLFSASNGDVEPALKLWRTWIETEEHPFTRKRADVKRMRSRGVLAGDIVKAVFEGALPNARSGGVEKVRADGEEAKPASSWSITGPKGPYLASVMTVLIEHGWANDGMWANGGLVQGGLLVVGDWVSIQISSAYLRQRLIAFVVPGRNRTTSCEHYRSYLPFPRKRSLPSSLTSRNTTSLLPRWALPVLLLLLLSLTS